MNAPHTPEVQAVLAMTAESIGKDILQALVAEIRLMPEVWQKLSQSKQQDIIERLHKRVADNVRMACHLIASEGRSVIMGDLDAIAIKDGIKATFKVSAGNESRHDLFDAVGKACLLVVADSGQHMQGMGEVRGEADQRAMDLGHEYDPKGDGKGVGQAAGSDTKALPGVVPDHEGPAADDPVYQQAVQMVIHEQRVSISWLQRNLRIGYNRAARLIEQMELDGIVSVQDANGGRMVMKKEGE